METLVTLEDVSYSVGPVEILKNISLEIHQGQTTMIAGMSGGGKSTLLMMAAALLYPTSGKTYIFGIDITRANQEELKAAQRKSGFLFQNSALIANMTVYQNIELPLRYFDSENTRQVTDKVNSFIDRFNLQDVQHQLPAGLSFGKQKLVALARLLISDPPIIYFDEPFAGIDSFHKNIIIQKIRELKTEGKTIIAVSHNTRDMMALCDWLWIVKNGELKYSGLLADEQTRLNSYVREVINFKNNNSAGSTQAGGQNIIQNSEVPKDINNTQIPPGAPNGIQI